MRTGRLLLIALTLSGIAGAVGAAPSPDSVGTSSDDSNSMRQSRDDAWWTGPLLAASPATLSPGHFLIEPYLFDAIPRGRYDDDGKRQPGGAHQNNFGSQSYVLYGLVDSVSIGLIPRFGCNEWSAGHGSSRPGVGDLTLQAQYGLTRYEEGTWIPTTALVLGETLPTGKFDRLGDRPADGLGAGVYTTTVSLYSQYFFWLPTGRILRTRLDVSYSFSGSAAVHDVSVYGTSQGFLGRVYPGDSILADGAFEYSLTRNWVLALDVVYEHDANTRLASVDAASGGSGFPPPTGLDSGTGHTWSLAPAIEYNFNSRIGVIAGAKLTVAGRNATAEVIPVAAINIVI
jgi:hypothetical protein